MHNLRPAILDQGLVPATQWLAESFERRTGIRTLVVTNQSTQPLSKDIQLTAYRTVQEALTNTSKYSECRNLKLEISDFDGVLTVEVADDGKGFRLEDRKKSNAFGLRGLEERAKSVGGWLDVITEQGKGTTLLLTVPLTSGKAKSGGEHGLD
jgi:signal transduction histidine kinase